MKLTDARALGLGEPPVVPPYTLLCFSHLRWDFVLQRPQHLLSRFASDHPVIYWEEPIMVQEGTAPRIDTRVCSWSGVTVVTPRLPAGLAPARQKSALRELLDGFLATRAGLFVRWYYTPLMLPFSQHVPAAAVVYDCMDELANFKFASPDLVPLERQLLDQADIVFTGGFSLFEAKKALHDNIHPFPSSVDRPHFAQARGPVAEPADQQGIARPRLGFFGVIDQRMDLDLLESLAGARPDWSFVIVGPVVKIDPASLPKRPNLHYLGGKTYDELPKYLAGWDVALMPFAINESTRFISPTKTPEYLAGRAREIADAHDKVSVDVMDRAAIIAAGMGGLEAVSKGGEDVEPRLITLKYRGKGSGEKLGLVGKSVTFDTGGISIKPSAGMHEMKMDMSGGAAVLEAVDAAASAEGRRRAAPDAALTDVLTDLGFEPRETGDGAVVLGNCPFHALATSHTALVCGMNLGMLTALLDERGEPVSATLDPAPGRCCVVLHPAS